MKELKERYDQLKKKYTLPDFDELNIDFDIEDIDAESLLILQRIRIKMYEKIEFFSHMIASRLQPDSSLADMYEAHYIDDDEKNNAYVLFKRLMHLVRDSNYVTITNRETENANFIKEAYAEWSTLKPAIQKHLRILKAVWDKETDIKEDLSYFG